MSTHPRVLVIDDDEVAREAMREILEGAGCVVIDASSPIGATKSIVDNRIDVIVLDVMMPDISGDKLATLLRSNPRMHQLSIILVSGVDATKLAQLAAGVKADALVAKADIHRELSQAVVAAFMRKQVRITNR